MSERNVIHHGDCIEVMASLPADSVDAIVTDPPYDLTTVKRFGPGQAEATTAIGRRLTGGFMGKTWDATGIAFTVELWGEALCVLKPGGHLVAFGGTRTYHRMACAIEDAGFEIRDCLQWLYGSGFPKSKNIGDGWGTALKPACEPIVLARKPLSERSVAANVLRWGVGGLNVDGCRIGTPEDKRAAGTRAYTRKETAGRGESDYQLAPHDGLGRWPANVLLDDEAAVLLDEQSGVCRDGVAVNRNRGDVRPQWVAGVPKRVLHEDVGYGGGGGASRFFYTAKADAAERSAGLGARNSHPTVKPVDLMGWLIRLVCPPGGVALDPFLGSGSTAVAAIGQGFDYIGIEREDEYVQIALQRIGLGARLAS